MISLNSKRFKLLLKIGHYLILKNRKTGNRFYFLFLLIEFIPF